MPNIVRTGVTGAKLYVFVQPDEPAIKKGIWLKTTAKEVLKKVIFDNAPYAAGGLIHPSISLPNAFTAAGTFFYNGKIYFVATGNSDYNAYDIATGTFSKVNSLAYAHGVAIDNVYYAFGTGTNSCIAYHMDTGTCTVLSTQQGYITDKCCFAAVNGKIYIFPDKISTKPSVFDPATNVFKNISPSPGYDYATCIVYGNKIYMFLLSGSSTSAYVYDPASDVYSNLAVYANIGYGGGGCVVGNEIYLFGGVRYIYPQYPSVNNIVAYKPDTNTYRDIGNLETSRFGCRVIKVGNIIYIAGGESYDGSNYSYPATMERFSLSSKSYPYDPAAIIYRLDGDTTFQTNLASMHLCDGLPVYFKDAMLYKNGSLSYPELYVGNDNTWIKERDAE